MSDELSSDDLLRMLAIMDAARREVVVAVPEIPKVDTEREVRILETKGGKTALTQAKKPRRNRDHWKVKQRKKRERMRPYMARKYREELMPRRKKLAEDGMWWEYYVMEWKKRSLKIEVSREEWESEVAPCIKHEHVPIIFRFNTGRIPGMISLVMPRSWARFTKSK